MALTDLSEPPHYQQIAERAVQLSLLGMNANRIAAALEVDRTTVARALRRLHGKSSAGAQGKAVDTLVDNQEFAAAVTQRDNIQFTLEPLNTRDTPGFLISATSRAMQVIDAVGSKEPVPAVRHLPRAGDGGCCRREQERWRPLTAAWPESSSGDIFCIAFQRDLSDHRFAAQPLGVSPCSRRLSIRVRAPRPRAGPRDPASPYPPSSRCRRTSAGID